MKQSKKKIPVTILTGFLGSGKTTLLNHILSSMHGLKLAVIENQFGQVGVDEHLVKQNIYSEEQVIQTMNGCICCTVRGDLSKIIVRLLVQEKRVFDAIIIETTGMADPAPVAQTFFVDQTVCALTTLDGIITVVDAKHIVQHLKEQKPLGAQNESIEQIAFADRLILNKTDLVTPEELEFITKQIRNINSEAEIIHSQYSVVDPKKLIGIQSFKLSKVLQMDAEFLNVDQQHIHDQSVSSCGCVLTEPISLGKLQRWISELIQTKSNDLYRYKGVINVVGMDNPYVFQGVHMLFTGSFIKDGWHQTKPRQTYFCFIGKNIDRQYLINGFKKCAAQKLSYSIGDIVECKVQSGPLGWRQGKIIALWDEGNPYRIQLKNGTNVHCPDQIPQLIRLKQKGKNKVSEYSDLIKEAEQIKMEGNQYYSLQKYELALSEYSKGLDMVEKKLKQVAPIIGVTPEDLQDMKIKFKKNVALTCLKSQKLQKAIQICDEIILQNPEDSKSFYVKGHSLLKLGKISKALESFEGALKLDAKNPQIIKGIEQCRKNIVKNWTVSKCQQ